MLVQYVAKLVALLRCVIERAAVGLLEQKTVEVEQSRLGILLVLLCDDEFGVSYYLVEAAIAHLCQVFAHLLGYEGEVVDQIFGLAAEQLAQFGVLCGYAHWTCVEVAFTHHHTTEHDQRCSTESELLCTEQSHEHNIASCLQLAVHLQANLTAQTVLDECLLSFRQSDFGRNTGKSHARCRRSTSTTFGS